MRTKKIDENLIIEATIRLVAREGLENASTRRIAKECGISEGSTFNYFASKADLLVACLYHIDNAIDAALQEVPFNILTLKKNVRTMWFAYYDFLVTHGDYAKFYRQFRQSSYYTEEVINGQDKSFSFFSGFLRKLEPLLPISIDAFWVFVIESTLNIAIRVADKQLPDTEKDRELYFNLMVNGMSGVFKNAKGWEE